MLMVWKCYNDRSANANATPMSVLESKFNTPILLEVEIGLIISCGVHRNFCLCLWSYISHWRPMNSRQGCTTMGCTTMCCVRKVSGLVLAISTQSKMWGPKTMERWPDSSKQLLMCRTQRRCTCALCGDTPPRVSRLCSPLLPESDIQTCYCLQP